MVVYVVLNMSHGTIAGVYFQERDAASYVSRHFNSSYSISEHTVIGISVSSSAGAKV